MLTGAATPRLVGTAPGDAGRLPLAQRSWSQVPVQVDERAVVDLNKVYNGVASGLTQLTYTDPGTFRRPNRTHRGRDDTSPSSASMARQKAPAGSARRRRGRLGEEGRRIAESPTAAYVYLFRQPAGPERGAATSATTSAWPPGPTDDLRLGAGQDSTITTSSYTQHFRPLGDDGVADHGPGRLGRGHPRPTRTCSPRAPARAARTPSRPAKARSSSTRAGRSARCAPTSAPTAAPTPSGCTSSTSAARTSRRTCASTRSQASWTSSTTAPRRPTTYRQPQPGRRARGRDPRHALLLWSLTWESVDGAQVPGCGTTLTTHIPGFASTSYYLTMKRRRPPPRTQCTGHGLAHGSSGAAHRPGHPTLTRRRDGASPDRDRPPPSVRAARPTARAARTDRASAAGRRLPQG